MTRAQRLGGEIRHRVEGEPNSHRQIFLPGDVGKFLESTSRPRGSESGRFGEWGEGASAQAGKWIRRKNMARVCRDRDGDSQPRPLRQFLDAVVPLRHVTRVRALQDVEVIHEPPRDRVRGRRDGEEAGLFQERAVRVHADHGLEHQPRFFLERHLLEQVLDALLDGAARVFVGIELVRSCSGRGT